MFTSVLRDLRSLKHLSLQGCLPTDHAVRSVSALLVNTRNLEVLSLFPLEETSSDFSDVESDIDPDGEWDSDPDDGSDTDADASSYTDPYTDPYTESDTEPKDSVINNGIEYSSWIPESLWRTYVRCLDRSVRRINIGNYKGWPLEKMLARFLLSRAAALEEFSVTLAAGLYPQKDEIAKELASWRWNHVEISSRKLKKGYWKGIIAPRRQLP